jgi:ADP-dependent NAD(P)H-hydrate dehydratase
VTPSSERPVPLTPDLLRRWPLPPPQEDKHARGVVLIVGGAGRTPGAALLAGIASLRVGAGQLRLAVADTAASAMAVAVPEALVAPLGTAPESGDITVEAVPLVLEQAQGIDVLCLGPGLSGDRASRDLTTALIGKLDPSVNVVLDAMALTALRPGLRGADRPQPFVVTPNLGEAAHLLGTDRHLQPEDGPDAARRIAERYGVVAMVHGAVAECAQKQTWLDDTGTQGLATSGSGDVLAGVVAGLLARGASAAQAAVWGTHLHAAAGRLCDAQIGAVGYLASDIADALPRALTRVSAPS